MLPTVDFCFKELMQNEKVRKGFIAALLGKKPEDIRKTTLIPTVLPPETGDDKVGVLDTAVLLQDGTQIDMEMQVIYFFILDKPDFVLPGKTVYRSDQKRRVL